MKIRVERRNDVSFLHLIYSIELIFDYFFVLQFLGQNRKSDFCAFAQTRLQIYVSRQLQYYFPANIQTQPRPVFVDLAGVFALSEFFEQIHFVPFTHTTTSVSHFEFD